MNREHPLLKKINKVLFYVIIPVIIAAMLLYIILAPSVIQLNEDYYLTVTEQGGVIRVTGGTNVIGPGNVKVDARYPWVYGVVDDQFFLLDLEENKYDVMPEQKMRQRLIANAIPLPDTAQWHENCLNWHELKASHEMLSRLKHRLSKPREKKNSLFF